jgi:hypothetical protein
VTVIWLSAIVDGELIGKMLVDMPSPKWHAPQIGVSIVVRCRSVARSYALVFGLCYAP